MSGMKTEGEELKKLLKLGRKRPLPFGFCIGPGDEDHVLIIHRKRKPETLGKAARTEGLGTKIAFGTLTVSGRLITLTCKREAPALAKKMKRFMIRQKLKMNVLVLDAAGRELESDIEELEEDPDWDRDDRASGDTAQEAGSDTPSGPETDDGPPGPAPFPAPRSSAPPWPGRRPSAAPPPAPAPVSAFRPGRPGAP